MKSTASATRWAAEAGVVALLYYGATALGLPLALEKTNASPVWPASGVAFAARTGTTFRIYLPRAYEDADAGATSGAPQEGAAPPRGSGVVLLVEDEADVRILAEEILRASGYTVFAPVGAWDALALAERHAGPIDVLVTDVVMPHMSGSELADRLTRLRPSLKVLYMSGYTGDLIARHGVLGSTALLEKPFQPDTLARRVQEILDAP